MTVAGMTLTASGDVTALEVADAFHYQQLINSSFTGTFTGWSASSHIGAAGTFTSTVIGNVPDLTATTAGLTAVAAVAAVAGVTAVTAVAAVVGVTAVTAVPEVVGVTAVAAVAAVVGVTAVAAVAEVVGVSAVAAVAGVVGVSAVAAVAEVVGVSALNAHSTLTAMDTLTGFASGIDKLSLLSPTGTAAITPTAMLRVADVATSDDLALTLNTAFSGFAANQAGLIVITAGLAAGNYLYANDSNSAYSTTADIFIMLVGVTGTMGVVGALVVSDYFA